jgi:glycerol-3-phosphate dehydrogenase
VNNLSDFLIRRTGRLYFERNYILSIYQILKDRIAGKLNWTDKQIKAYDKSFMSEYESVMKFAQQQPA